MALPNHDQNVFFKYRPISTSRSKKMLKNYFLRNELWYAKPVCLNDPFDCMPCVTVNGVPNRRHSLSFFKAIDESTGVLSMSKNPKSTQQWSYYAEEHRGICIGFNMSHVEPQEKYHVEYRSERVVVPHELLLSDKSDDQEKRNELMLSSITTKALQWSHEDEYRFLKPSEGVSKFPAQNLVSVYFGYRCSETDISYIETLVQRSECEPHFAIMRPAEDESFEMEIFPEDDFDYLRRIARETLNMSY